MFALASRSRAASRVALALVLLAACGREPTAPARVAAPRLATTAVDAASANRLVLFASGVPTGFAARVAALGGTIGSTHDGAGVALVRGLSDDAAAQLAMLPGVSLVAADQSFSLTPIANPATQRGTRAASASDPAAAALYPSQWNLRAIGADAAWAAGALGSSAVRVAILDTGIDYDNPELVGLVDLSRSMSFVPSDDQLVASYFPGKNAVTDLHIHGTHVASIVSSHALLTAGVTSQLTLMAVKVLDVNGVGTVGGTLTGILWAADHGADVINLSLDGSFARHGAQQVVHVIDRVLDYAHRKGVTVVVAAGNASLDLDQDKADYQTYCDAPNVICVSATGPTFELTSSGPWTNVDAFAPYSNFGRRAIDVAAPGGNYSPVWGPCSMTSLVFPFCSFGGITVGLVGTSMATPHVSALAGLLVERLGRDPSRIKKAIERSADDLGANGDDPYYGNGRISVKRALGL